MTIELLSRSFYGGRCSIDEYCTDEPLEEPSVFESIDISIGKVFMPFVYD